MGISSKFSIFSVTAEKWAVTHGVAQMTATAIKDIVDFIIDEGVEITIEK